jgi:hypothetical protein
MHRLVIQKSVGVGRRGFYFSGLTALLFFSYCFYAQGAMKRKLSSQPRVGPAIAEWHKLVMMIFMLKTVTLLELLRR